MKLVANTYPYSSIVGGGIMLIDEMGITRFLIGMMGTTQGINKEENDALCQQLERLINTSGGLNVPAR